MSLKTWLKHAFAVETDIPPPTDEELRIARQMAREIVRRGMTVPAIAFLEMSRPMNYVGAQLMHFFEPMLSALAQTHDYRVFAQFLERRDAVDVLCQIIEEIDSKGPCDVQGNRVPSEADAKP